MIEKLKKQIEENPLQAIAIGSLAATAASKLIDTLSGVQSRRAYSKQISHKIKK